MGSGAPRDGSQAHGGNRLEVIDRALASRGQARRAWPRALVWPQLVLGWLPVFVLYAGLIFSQHQPMSVAHAAALALRSLFPAALLGIFVYRFAQHVPWPRPFRLRFALIHIVAALAYALAWILAASIVESAIHRRLMIVVGPGLIPYAVVGIWLYVMVAGISYAIEGTELAARAEAASVRMQLGALRAQLNPHFLFNALHTVVQLIPIDPQRASDAAEQVAALLRTALQEDRDLVPLRDEWAFVSRYLELERTRFGDRLRVRTEIDASLMHARVPSFALQTLVENSVRHGATPRVEPTDITITAAADAQTLRLQVHDSGAGFSLPGYGGAANAGTGLSRLRERLAALYGDASSLALTSNAGGGCTATLILPRSEEE
jgi:sensor histidine kinase YesM